MHSRKRPSSTFPSRKNTPWVAVSRVGVRHGPTEPFPHTPVRVDGNAWVHAERETETETETEYE